MNLLTRLLVTVTLTFATFSTIAAPVTGQGTWETTLKARDINGNAVALNSASAAFFYDTTLNITWLANMNTNPGGPSGLGLIWDDAIAWADSLSIGGFTDWRLPKVIDVGSPGCPPNFSESGGTECGFNVQTQVNGAYNEWAHLFYVTLGNLAIYDDMGVLRNPSTGGGTGGLTNTAHFQDMQAYIYWTETENSADTTLAWYFFPDQGKQDEFEKSEFAYAVAVRSGDVLVAAGGNSVPEPQSLALAMTALVGLGAAIRRRHRT